MSTDDDSLSEGGGLVDLSSIRKAAASSGADGMGAGGYGLGFDIDEAVKVCHRLQAFLPRKKRKRNIWISKKKKKTVFGKKKTPSLCFKNI
jgi:hypothetical protein